MCFLGKKRERGTERERDTHTHTHTHGSGGGGGGEGGGEVVSRKSALLSHSSFHRQIHHDGNEAISKCYFGHYA